MNWVINYLQEVATEMRKVNWPSRQELISSTGITILATFLIAGYIFGIDQIVSGLLEMIY